MPILAVLDFGNLDFVVQKGDLFIQIEVKHHAGHIDLVGTTLVRNGKPFYPRNPLEQLRDNHYKLHNALIQRLGHPGRVVSILVFFNKRAWVNAPQKLADNAYITHLRGLLKLITQLS